MHSKITRILQTGDHPVFQNNPFYQTRQNEIWQLCQQEYSSVIEHLNASTKVNLFEAIGQAQSLEHDHKEFLQNLAEKIARDYLHIPEKIPFSVHLDNPVNHPGLAEIGDKPVIKKSCQKCADSNCNTDEVKSSKPEKNYTAKQLELEVAKRRIINMICDGAAMRGQWQYVLHRQELESRMGPDIINLYNSLLSQGVMMYWTLDPDQFYAYGLEMKSQNHNGNGGRMGLTEMPNPKYEAPEYDIRQDYYDPEEYAQMLAEEGKDTLQNEEPETVVGIKSVAVVFPVLIQETLKGAMHYLAALALPEDDQLRIEVLTKADKLEYEFWDIRVGPGIWGQILSLLEVEDMDYLHYYLYDLFNKPAEEFIYFMMSVLKPTEKFLAEQKEYFRTLKKELL